MSVLPTEQKSNRFQVLDGWRGLSISLVLAAHLLPLGPKSWQLNSTFGPVGMALFFTLSGFLITNFLIHKKNIVDFIIRRFFRILPLAWLYVVIVLLLVNENSSTYLAHIFFYGNIPPIKLIDPTSHIWSLCVEMQFYVAIAMIVTFFKDKGLLLIPILCVMITAFRIYHGVHIGIVTYFRVDEILAGCILALIYNNRIKVNTDIIFGFNQYIIFLFFIISCHPQAGFMNYLRPYFAALLVGSTLYNSSSSLPRMLNTRTLFYLASISYALYVIHGGMRYTWLGEGDTLEKYLKRPLFIFVLFVLAHVSTYYYEHKCISFGKSLSKKLQAKQSIPD